MVLDLLDQDDRVSDNHAHEGQHAEVGDESNRLIENEHADDDAADITGNVTLNIYSVMTTRFPLRSWSISSVMIKNTIAGTGTSKYFIDFALSSMEPPAVIE